MCMIWHDLLQIDIFPCALFPFPAPKKHQDIHTFRSAQGIHFHSSSDLGRSSVRPLRGNYFSTFRYGYHRQWTLSCPLDSLVAGTNICIFVRTPGSLYFCAKENCDTWGAFQFIDLKYVSMRTVLKTRHNLRRLFVRARNSIVLRFVKCQIISRGLHHSSGRKPVWNVKECAL